MRIYPSVLLTAAAVCVFDLREGMRCSLEKCSLAWGQLLARKLMHHNFSRGLEVVCAWTVFYGSTMPEGRQGLCAMRSAPVSPVHLVCSGCTHGC